MAVVVCFSNPVFHGPLLNTTVPFGLVPQEIPTFVSTNNDTTVIPVTFSA